MISVQKINSCIELCVRIKNKIQCDSEVNSKSLGGLTLQAYEEVRSSQLHEIEDICKELMMIQEKAKY